MKTYNQPKTNVMPVCSQTVLCASGRGYTGGDPQYAQ